MKRNFTSYCFLFCLLLISCTEKKSLLSNTEWLSGTWVSQTSKGSLYETWQKADEHRMTAKSYYLNNADTVLFETVELKEVGDKLLYIVSAPEEKKELPIPFSSIELAPGKFVFENKAHDFPQLITYQKITRDSLIAEISGMVEGNMLREQFAMKKIR